MVIIIRRFKFSTPFNESLIVMNESLKVITVRRFKFSTLLNESLIAKIITRLHAFNAFKRIVDSYNCYEVASFNTFQ